MEEATRIDLEHGEAAVAHIASRIFSAYIANGQCAADNEDAMLKKSIDMAIKLAKDVDVAVSSGSEVRSELPSDMSYKPLG